MLDSYSISRLYANVLHNDMLTNHILPENIRDGIKNMAHVYAPDTMSFDDDRSARQYSNFNDVGFRCAYLHKYAPLHTFIVLDVMLRILQEKLDLFQAVATSGEFKFCSLGGGPGSDAIGVLAAMHTAFNNFKSSVTIIDSMEKWEATFSSIIRELRFGEYGACWKNIGNKFQWSYIGADLLCTMTNEVNKSIACASFITMVKFISAATCTDTESMVEKIFRVMKPGALVLFIDNAAGGFTQVVERASKKYNFRPKFGPHRHLQYSNEDLKIKRFGFDSCTNTTVTVILLQKPFGPLQTASPSRRNPQQKTSGARKPLVPVQNINETSPRKLVPAQLNSEKLLFPNKSSARSGRPFEQPSSSYAQSNKPPFQNENIADKLSVKSDNRFSKQNTVADVYRVPKPFAPTRSINEISPGEAVRAQSRVGKLMFPNNDSGRPLEYSSSSYALSNNINKPFNFDADRRKLAVKNDNLNRSMQKYYRVPAISPASQNSETEDEGDNGCCSCCVIS